MSGKSEEPVPLAKKMFISTSEDSNSDSTHSSDSENATKQRRKQRWHKKRKPSKTAKNDKQQSNEQQQRTTCNEQITDPFDLLKETGRDGKPKVPELVRPPLTDEAPPKTVGIEPAITADGPFDEINEFPGLSDGAVDGILNSLETPSEDQSQHTEVAFEVEVEAGNNNHQEMVNLLLMRMNNICMKSIVAETIEDMAAVVEQRAVDNDNSGETAEEHTSQHGKTPIFMIHGLLRFFFETLGISELC